MKRMIIDTIAGAIGLIVFVGVLWMLLVVMSQTAYGQYQNRAIDEGARYETQRLMRQQNRELRGIREALEPPPQALPSYPTVPIGGTYTGPVDSMTSCFVASDMPYFTPKERELWVQIMKAWPQGGMNATEHLIAELQWLYQQENQ